MAKPIVVKRDGVTVGLFENMQTLQDFVGYAPSGRMLRREKRERAWRGRSSTFMIQYLEDALGGQKVIWQPKDAWYCTKHQVWIAGKNKCPLCLADELKKEAKAIDWWSDED